MPDARCMIQEARGCVVDHVLLAAHIFLQNQLYCNLILGFKKVKKCLFSGGFLG